MANGELRALLAVDRERPIVTIAMYAWWTLAAVVILLTLLMTIRAYLPIPIWDEWAFLTAADHIAKLFVPHANHVIFFPHLFYLIDKTLFSGSEIFDLFAALAIGFIDAVLLAWVAWRAGLSFIYCGFVFIALFWAYPITNFVTGFDLQIIGVYAAATAAFAVLAFRRERGLVWAVILGFVATFSMANGLLTGVLLAPLAYFLALPRRHVVVAAVSGAAMAAGYFLCMLPYRTPSLCAAVYSDAHVGASALSSIGTIATYFGVYLGVPIERLIFRSSAMSDATVLIAAVIGYAGLALLSFLILKAYRANQLRRQPALLTLISVALFVVATGVLTAYGRGVECPMYTAGTGRYGTPQVMFWMVTILIAGVAKLSDKPWGAKVPAAAAVLLGLAMAVSEPFIMKTAITSPGMSSSEVTAREQFVTQHQADRLGAVTAILSNVDDEAAFVFVSQYRELNVRAAPLRAAKLAPFDSAWARWLGEQLPSSIQRNNTGCQGTLDTVIPLSEGGWRVSGEFHGPETYASKVILLSTDGRVVGYGMRSPGRTLFEAMLNSNPRWQGHISGMARGEVISYALDLHKNSACAFGHISLMPSAVKPPAVRRAS